MKLREGNIFIGLVRAPAGGWTARAEAWSSCGCRRLREVKLEAEPAYDSFVVTMGELIAELAGEPE